MPLSKTHLRYSSTGTVHSISELKVALDDKHLLNSKEETRETEIDSVLTVSLSHSAPSALPVTSTAASFCLSFLSLCGPEGRLVVLRLYAC